MKKLLAALLALLCLPVMTALGDTQGDFTYALTPEGAVVTAAVFRPPKGDPAALEARMAEQLARRDATQPVKDRTAGSTVRNPAGFSSTGRADDVHDLKAWKLIDDAGLRGHRRGAALRTDRRGAGRRGALLREVPAERPVSRRICRRICGRFRAGDR